MAASDHPGGEEKEEFSSNHHFVSDLLLSSLALISAATGWGHRIKPTRETQPQKPIGTTNLPVHQYKQVWASLIVQFFSITVCTYFVSSVFSYVWRHENRNVEDKKWQKREREALTVCENGIKEILIWISGDQLKLWSFGLWEEDEG